MVFRFLQTDPETSAIHVNMTAVQQHRCSDAMVSALAHFTGNATLGRLQELMAAPPSETRAAEVATLSHLLHEGRHHADMILTPFGFYRIRAAFEFYQVIGQLMADTAPKVMFPLQLNLDPVHRTLNGLSFDDPIWPRIFHLVHNRHDIVLSDNRKLPIDGETLFASGGDAMMEALAFSSGVEFVRRFFDDPHTRAALPVAFDERQTRQMKATYLWHFGFMPVLDREPGVGTARLVVTMMYAALCGSFARDARFRTVEGGSGNPAPLDERAPSRDVTGRIPSQRFEALYAHFANLAERMRFADLPPDEILELVEVACEKLFGQRFTDEMELDVAADEALIVAAREDDVAGVFGVMGDLVRYRRHLLTAFKANPAAFLSPGIFADTFDRHIRPSVLYCYPAGIWEERGQKPVILIDQPTRVPDAFAKAMGREPEPGKVLVMSRVFMTRLKGDAGAKLMKDPNRWDVILGSLSPMFKLAMYGCKYRTLLEADILVARKFLQKHAPAIKINPFWDNPEDFSGVGDFLSFHGLEEAQCDVCLTPHGADGLTWVSARTFHTSETALARYLDGVEPENREAAAWFCENDYSGWKLCDACLTGLGFRR